MNMPTEPQAIPGIKHILLVASGKGGVGKSTVAVNLAVALSKKHRVGLLDADIFGPSIPRMVGGLNQSPVSDENGHIEPLTNFGIKVMSIGFVVAANTSVVWRGPMLFKAIDQFLYDVKWGELDYLVIDLPPGTGDVQLTLAQRIAITGAVIVSTPQNMALADVKKAVDMFERMHVPILGAIENMSFMRNPVNGEKMQLYPPGDLDGYLNEKGILKIGEIPFHPKIALSCEAGIPLLSRDKVSQEAQEFFDICEHIDDLLSETAPLPTPSVQNSPQKGGCGTGCGCAEAGR